MNHYSAFSSSLRHLTLLSIYPRHLNSRSWPVSLFNPGKKSPAEHSFPIGHPVNGIFSPLNIPYYWQGVAIRQTCIRPMGWLIYSLHRFLERQANFMQCRSSGQILLAILEEVYFNSFCSSEERAIHVLILKSAMWKF